jgi:hypothetical protein
VALEVESVVNRTVHAEKTLGGSSRLEPLQLALAASDCLMRILRPIVLSKPLLMPADQSETPERGGVGAQLVGDQQFRHEALLLEQLAQQPQRRPTIASTPNQHVENLALMVDGTPEIHPLAGDAHHHLVEMLAIARSRVTLAQPSCDHGTEFQHPAPYGLVGDLKPALGQQFLDIAVAQGNAEIEPDRVLDDLGREPMAAVAKRSHPGILPDTSLAPDPVSVTMPAGETASPSLPKSGGNKSRAYRSGCEPTTGSVDRHRSKKTMWDEVRGAWIICLTVATVFFAYPVVMQWCTFKKQGIPAPE